MNLEQIRRYTRVLADELTEYPEGFIENTDLDILINIAQNNVQLEIIKYVPKCFRKTTLFSITTGVPDYNIVSDLGITNHLRLEVILRNKPGELPKPLIEIDPEDAWQWTAGSEPRAWYQEERLVIMLTPPAAETYADRYKIYHFEELPDLNQDSTHDPSTGKYSIPDMPKIAHPLISLDTLRQWAIADEEYASDINARWEEMVSKVVIELSTDSLIKARLKPKRKEYIR